MSAADEGHTEVVKTLINAGADVNARDKEDWTALNYASWKGHMKIVQALEAAGAKE